MNAPAHSLSAVQFLTDLGFSAATLAFFAAWQAYRANPHRAINRYFAGLSIAIGMWQLVVMMARVTREYFPWGPMAAPFAGVFALGLFLMHDSVVRPVVKMSQRLRDNPMVFVCALSATTGSILAYVSSIAPVYSPLLVRTITIGSLTVAFYKSFMNQRRHGVHNPYEMRLFVALATMLFSCFVVLLLLRTPVGSRINSLMVIVSFLWTNWLILSERALEVGTSGRVSMIHILCAIALGVVNMLIAFLLTSFANISDFFPTPALLLIATICNYPAFVFLNNWANRLALRFPQAARARVRDNALDNLKEETTIPGILKNLQALCESCLQDAKVAVSTKTPVMLEQVFSPDHSILTPEIALLRLKEPQQSVALATFAEGRIGATVQVKHVTRTVYLVIGTRAGSFLRDELETVASIARLGAVFIEKVEAVDAAARASSLASVGRLAANFSHEARNQLAAITEVLDTLRRGEEADLSPEYREAVHGQAVALAGSHNFALSVTRLKNPHHVDSLSPSNLDHETSAALSLCRSLLASSRVEMKYEKDADSTDSVLLDPTMYQRILFNLIQNSVQAFVSAGTIDPKITISVVGGPTQCKVEVFDNGPGVPETVHDSLFVPYSTSKVDGTGLGLSFCKDMLTKWGGSLEYLSPKGTPNAHFLITLRRRTSPVPSRAPIGVSPRIVSS